MAQVALPEAAVQVAAGGYMSFALTVSGALYAWGSNGNGEQGSGQWSWSGSRPNLVNALSDGRVKQVPTSVTPALTPTPLCALQAPLPCTSTEFQSRAMLCRAMLCHAMLYQIRLRLQCDHCPIACGLSRPPTQTGTHPKGTAATSFGVHQNRLATIPAAMPFVRLRSPSAVLHLR